MSGAGLTEAQRAILTKLSSFGRAVTTSSFTPSGCQASGPLRVLRQMGLVSSTKRNNLVLLWWDITPAGRAALSQATGGGG